MAAISTRLDDLLSTVQDVAVSNAVHHLVAGKPCESAAAIPAIAFTNNNTTTPSTQTSKATKAIHHCHQIRNKMNSVAVILLTLMVKSEASAPSRTRSIPRLIHEERRRLKTSGFISVQRSATSAFIDKHVDKSKDFISKGGYGKVYRVRTVGKNAVIKVFEQGTDQQKIKDCERERAILEEIASYEAEQGRTLQISHILKDPAVVSPLLMLEYIDGKDLTKADFGDYSMPELVNTIHSMMQQISGVLKGLHSIYIYHNDIKPANILYVPSTESLDKPKFYLIDFGSAVDGYAGPAQPRGQWSWGTFPFASPYLYQIREDAKAWKKISSEAAKRADYYSLALTVIDTIRMHCSVKSGDALCSMAHELFALRKDWKTNMPYPVLQKKIMSYWIEVAQRIPKFREEHPTMHPEFMELLQKWISCKGFAVCQQIR